MQAVCGLKTNRKYNVIFSLSSIFSVDNVSSPLGYEDDALLFYDTRQEAAGLARYPYARCCYQRGAEAFDRSIGYYEGDRVFNCEISICSIHILKGKR
jgi:hypothetical protein